MKMKPLFICYPRCSTCQKALKWLQERGIEVEVRDIVQQNPSEAELEEWIDRSGLAVNRFFNTSGLRYKALNLKEKVRTASREELIRVLSTDGMLVKRPLLIASDKILVGFREPEWAAALSEKDRRFRLYRNRKRTEIFRPQGLFFHFVGLSLPFDSLCGGPTSRSSPAYGPVRSIRRANRRWGGLSATPVYPFRSRCSGCRPGYSPLRPETGRAILTVGSVVRGIRSTGSFGYDGSLDDGRRNRSKSRFPKFVVVAARTYAAPVRSACQLFGGEVDDEFTRAADDVVGVPLRADRDVAHRGLVQTVPVQATVSRLYSSGWRRN